MPETTFKFDHEQNPLLRILFWLVAIAIGVFAIRQLAPLFSWVLNLLMPFMVALVIAYVFNPVVNFVQRQLKLGRTAGILVLVLAAALVLSGILIWIIPVLYSQTSRLVNDLRAELPLVFDRFMSRHFDSQQLTEWHQRIELSLANVEEWINQAFSSLLQPVARGSVSVAQSVFGWFGAVASLIGTTVIVVIVVFYYLVDMDEIPHIIRKLLPEKHRERIWELLLKSDRAVGGFLRGQLTSCICVGIMMSLLLFVIGMGQYAVLIGMLAGMANFIPYLGPVVGATPAILWILLSDEMNGWDERGVKLLMLAGGMAAIQAIEGFVLQPFVVGRNASLHPLTVIFALAVGSQAGLAGMIVAVPVACIVKVFWMELFWKERSDSVPARR